MSQAQVLSRSDEDELQSFAWFGSRQAIHAVLTIFRGEYNPELDIDKPHTVRSIEEFIDIFTSVGKGRRTVTLSVVFSRELLRDFNRYASFEELWGRRTLARAAAIVTALKRYKESPSARLFDFDEVEADVIRELESLERLAEARAYALPR